MKGKSYFSGPVCLAGAFLGAFAFLLSCLLTHHIPVSLTIGMGVALLSALAIPLVLYLEDRRYLGIEDDIPEEILLCEQINFSFPAHGRGGYICVTETAIYLFSRDRKPYLAYRIPRELMLSADMPSPISLRLCLAGVSEEYRSFTILSPRSGEIMDRLDSAGWFSDHAC